MLITQRYRYAILRNALYRFRSKRWEQYLLEVAKNNFASIDQYAEVIAFSVEDVTNMDSNLAQILLDSLSKDQLEDWPIKSENKNVR